MIIYEYTNKMYIARQDLRQIRRIIVADYRETVDYILGIPLFAQKIGKENLSSLLCRLGTLKNQYRLFMWLELTERDLPAELWHRC